MASERRTAGAARLDNTGAPLRLDDRDRGRLVLASVVTLVALPAIWLANRAGDDGGSARPNVAAVGIDAGGGADDAVDVLVPVFDPMGTTGAAYLDPLTTAAPTDSVVVQVGTTPDDPVATARGSYRRSIQSGTCLFNGFDSGEFVTVVNVANGRSTECTVVSSDQLDDVALLMSQSSFAGIAELTSAPIHLEIRQ